MVASPGRGGPARSLGNGDKLFTRKRAAEEESTAPRLSKRNAHKLPTRYDDSDTSDDGRGRVPYAGKGVGNLRERSKSPTGRLRKPPRVKAIRATLQKVVATETRGKGKNVKESEKVKVPIMAEDVAMEDVEGAGTVASTSAIPLEDSTDSQDASFVKREKSSTATRATRARTHNLTVDSSVEELAALFKKQRKATAPAESKKERKSTKKYGKKSSTALPSSPSVDSPTSYTTENPYPTPTSVSTVDLLSPSTAILPSTTPVDEDEVIDEESDSDDVVAAGLVRKAHSAPTSTSPSRNNRKDQVYPSPVVTPSRRRRSSSPLTPLGPSPTPRRRIPESLPVEMEIDEDDEEELEEEEADDEVEEEDAEVIEKAQSEDELDLLPAKSPQITPTKTLKKSDSTPTYSSQSNSTRRSSYRARNLPAAPMLLNKSTQGLAIKMGGFSVQPTLDSDDEDEEDDDDLEVEDAATTNEELVSTPSKSRPIHSATTLHPTAAFAPLLYQVGAQVCSPSGSSFIPAPAGSKRVADYPTIEGLEKWEKEVRFAMGDVVERGVGNCLVLLGQRGVGKTMIVERSMEIVAKVHGIDSFTPVRLNGLVQTTDRLVMREIARQLSTQGAIDESGDFGTHAATMTTLLRLLEPESSSSASSDKPVIFIVDGFDLFALHPRQSFLYCLLDIVQGNKRRAGVGVIGISSRTDCLSVLEKRVRSRCQSHVLQIAAENDFTAYVSLARSLLQVATLSDSDVSSTNLVAAWNKEVDAFLCDEPVTRYLDRLWKIHGSSPAPLRQALTVLYRKVEAATRDATEKAIPIPRLSRAFLPPKTNTGRDNLLQGLTILELSVCVAAKHLLSPPDNSFNLEMLYDLYSQHISRGKSGVATKGFTKNAFAMALDRLRTLEIIIPTTGKPTSFISPSIANNHKMWRLVAWPTTLDEEVATRKDAPEALKRWCKNW